MIIDKNRIIEGLRNGSIELVKSPHGDGVVCNIGEHWFYFGGKDAEFYGDPEQYMEDVGLRKIVNQIFEALESLKKGETEKDYSDEWWYYNFYLIKYAIRHNNIEIKRIIEKYDAEEELGWLITDDIFCGSGEIGDTQGS